MKVFQEASLLQKEMLALKMAGNSIGFVPTMGYLHEGHQQLMKEARKENDIVVVSIFVNPLQFGPNEDLDSYPRDFEHDEKIAQSENVDYIFYPTVEEMYPSQPVVKAIAVGKSDVLCGAKRPGHFDGVVTVVTKLFNIVQPTRAYFGLKDAQQVSIIESLISDFNFPIEIRKVDIVREADGLAKSSRNVYLTANERKEAPMLQKGLQQVKDQIRNGEFCAEALKQSLRSYYEKHLTGEIDYIEIFSYPALQSVERVENEDILIAVAYKYSRARLIDNLLIQGRE